MAVPSEQRRISERPWVSPRGRQYKKINLHYMRGVQHWLCENKEFHVKCKGLHLFMDICSRSPFKTLHVGIYWNKDRNEDKCSGRIRKEMAKKQEDKCKMPNICRIDRES